MEGLKALAVLLALVAGWLLVQRRLSKLGAKSEPVPLDGGTFPGRNWQSLGPQAGMVTIAGERWTLGAMPARRGLTLSTQQRRLFMSLELGLVDSSAEGALAAWNDSPMGREWRGSVEGEILLLLRRRVDGVRWSRELLESLEPALVSLRNHL